MTNDPDQISLFILEMERLGRVTRTFRRLDLERQQSIIAALLEETGEHGPDRLNIKRVASRAGISVGSLYQYFGSRDGLLDFAIELVVRVTVQTFDSYRAALAAMPLREALAAYMQGGIEWAKAQGGMVRFFALAAYRGDPDLAERVVRPIGAVMVRMSEDIFHAAASRGELRPGLDPTAAARSTNMFLIALGDSQLIPYLNNYYQFSDQNHSFESLFPAALEIILHGVSS